MSSARSDAGGGPRPPFTGNSGLSALGCTAAELQAARGDGGADRGRDARPQQRRRPSAQAPVRVVEPEGAQRANPLGARAHTLFRRRQRAPLP